jgi:hypothetical protein
MRPRALLTLSTAFVIALAAACNDGTGPTAGFVITGHLQNNTQAAIPAEARLVAVWSVSSGTPDYGYVFGEGTINRVTGTFRIRFDQPPPADALNASELGVALIILTTDQSLADGDIINNASPLNGLLGVTGQHAVIFVRNHEAARQLRDWVVLFDTGYSVGVGVKAPAGAVFDTFQPASPSSPLLIVDDLANLDVVNWT